MATKDLVLAALQASRGDYLSGEELSNTLDISRTSIWKAIKTLREEGHNIEAVTNKGYMLIPDTRLITESGVRDGLAEFCKDIPVHVFDTIDSTNAYAKKLALDGAPDGTVVIARTQTAGRGRLGRSFYSPREGIYISIIIKPEFDVSKSVLITSAAAVAVAQAIEDVAGQDAKIKWVNDIYVNDKKVCGILTEGMTDFETGRISNLIIGIGINTSIKDFPEELLGTVGAVEGDYSAAHLAGAVVSNTLKYAHDIEARAFMDVYRSKSLLTGRTVMTYKGSYKVSPEDELTGVPAKVLGIDDDGGLQVEFEDGSRQVLTTGEVTIRL
ncbi:MAG: biotin--[acetyl-CoA-carboxylase] ligase [Eubacterium sp.]|nr:biotin--[acetyl-CoA-carboxylase] ligase [Candidatus Colimonas fimequi]